MKKIVIILALTSIFMAQVPYQVLLNESEQYFFQSQQPCGGFFNCNYAPNRFDVFYSYLISDRYPMSYELAKTFDEQNYVNYYPLSEVMAPDSGMYAWGPLFDALAILSMNDTSPIVLSMEKIILSQFGTTGLHVGVSSVSYYPNSPYDFAATLMALEIAAKSKSVDGNLNDTKLLEQLDPNFWTALLDYIKSPTVDINTYDAEFASLIQMALGYPYYRERVCSVLNETYFSIIYRNFMTATPVTSYGMNTLASLGNAAMICAAYGYLNLTYAKDVEYWALMSILVNEGQLPLNNWILQDSYRLMIGEEPRGFSVFMVGSWPSFGGQATTNVPAPIKVVVGTNITKTVTRPYVVTETEVIMASVTRESFAAPTLLALLASKFRRRKRSK